MTVDTPVTSQSRIKDIFESQLRHRHDLANRSYADRRDRLKKLQRALTDFRQDIRDALWKDFRKHPSEVDLTEIYAVSNEIKHTLRHLRRWMKPVRVSAPTAQLGSSSWIKHEAKGVVLIISPWNFPVNLTFGPLVPAIAAGNAVMIKPSEHTPHTSALMARIVREIFPENEVALVEGGADTAKALLKLPFHHIFFTGAPTIGKVVMKAAADHLASVTLELGGKTPTIVDRSANLEVAARRIAWAKYINNGQICIAPDYLFVHEAVKDQLLDKIAAQTRKFFGEEAATSPSYARMVNDRHFRRVREYLTEAVEQGAEVRLGGHHAGEENFIAPTMVVNPPAKSKLMNEEIFGPILPVLTFADIKEVVDHINAGEKPLALYIYTGNQKMARRVIDRTSSGGVCINHSAVHFFNSYLPFGGANFSGIGKSHGWYGFQEFSNARGVYRQILPSAIDLLAPPYTNWKQRVIDLTIKWF